MERRVRRMVFIVLLLIVCVFTGDLGYQYSRHSTPIKALHAYDSGVGPFETVKFAKGVVLLTPGDEPQSFTAWYMTRNFWGWHVSNISSASILSPQNYNVDFQPFVEDGETFVWGTNMTPMKEIVDHSGGKTFTAPVGKFPVWYMVLPFAQTYFPHSAWSMIGSDGARASLFK